MHTSSSARSEEGELVFAAGELQQQRQVCGGGPVWMARHGTRPQGLSLLERGPSQCRSSAGNLARRKDVSSMMTQQPILHEGSDTALILHECSGRRRLSSCPRVHAPCPTHFQRRKEGRDGETVGGGRGEEAVGWLQGGGRERKAERWKR